MRPRRASFVISASEPKGFPPPGVAEIAFVGRSNVGKSSLINDLVGQSGLARTSRTPGRTRLVNWFEVEAVKDKLLHFVDLPGYGYAEVGAAMRQAWRPLIEAFLERPSLALVILLIDARREPGVEETDFLAWLAHRELRVQVVITKCDKLAKHERLPMQTRMKRSLGLARAPILFSTLDKLGHDELWRAIAATRS
jgi:GTP-binding protein